MFGKSESRFKLAGLMRTAVTIGVFAVALTGAHAAAPKANPDLGPNVLIFNDTMTPQEIQEKIDKVYGNDRKNEFETERHALLFLPGKYKVDVPIGFYTEVIGLGATPDDVSIEGNVHSDASLPRNNATCTFWRAAEKFQE